MQRLALALIALLVIALAVVIVAGMVRTAWRGADGPGREVQEGVGSVQKLAFVLLVSLIVYVSVVGAG
jgi:hypothetical protein